MTMEGRASAGPNSRSKNDNPNLVRVISLDAPGSGYGSGNTSPSKMEEESSIFSGNEEGRRSISENLSAEDLHQTVKPGEGVDALSVAGKAGFEAEGVSAEKEVVGNKGADKSDGLVVRGKSGAKKGIIGLSTELPVAEKGTAGDGEKKVQELTLNEFADEKKETGKEEQLVSVSSGDDIFVSSENDKETSQSGEKKETREPNIPTYGRGEISRHLGSLTKDGGGVGQGGVKIGEFGDFDEEKMTREQVEPSDKGKGGENKEDEFEDLNKLSAEAGVGVPEQKNEPDDFTSRQPERTTVVTGGEEKEMRKAEEKEMKKEMKKEEEKEMEEKKKREVTPFGRAVGEEEKNKPVSENSGENSSEEREVDMKAEDKTEKEESALETKEELSSEEKERLVELVDKFKELQEELERLQVLLTELKGQERDVLNKVEDAGLDGVSLDALKGEIGENEKRVGGLEKNLEKVVNDLLQKIKTSALVAEEVAKEPVLMENSSLAKGVKEARENQFETVSEGGAKGQLELERTEGGPSSVGKEKEQETDAGFEVKKINEKEVGISVEGPEKLLPAIKEAILLLDKEVSEEEARSMANSILTDLMKESLRAMAEKGYGRRGAILENEKLWSSLSSKDEIKVVLDDRGLRLSVAKVEEVLNS